VPRHVARLVTRLVAPLVVDYSALRRLVIDYFASAARLGARHVARLVMRLVTRLVVDYFDYAARPVASAHRAACRAAHHTAPRRLLRLAQARRRLLRLRRASGCLGAPRGSSLGSSLITPPHVWVSRHVAWLVTPLVVNYTASRRLVVDYFTSATRPGALARRTARHSAHRLSSTTSPKPHDRLPRLITRLVAWLVAPLVVDYFASDARLGASARRTARHADRRAARRRLLRLRRASGCLGTSRGSSHGSLRRSSSTTSPTPCVRVPQHVARLVKRLIVDYSVHRDFVLRPRWLYFSHAMRSDYLSRGNTSSTSSTPRAATTSSSGRIASTIHLD
jgi:hypothetical protein